MTLRVAVLAAGLASGFLAGCEGWQAEKAADAIGPAFPAAYTLSDSLPLAVAMDSARGLYLAGQLDTPLAWFDAIAETARDRGVSALEAEARTYACFALRRLGDLAAGRMQCEAALELTEAHGLGDQRITTLNALGLVAWHQSRLSEAASLFQASADLARAAGDEPGIARAEGNLGLVYVDYGAFDEARSLFENFRDAGRRLERPSYEANALTNLGMLAIWTGDPESAFGPLEEARRIYRENDDVYNAVNTTGQIATAWSAIGRQDRALAIMDTALDQARRLGLQQEVASNLEILADMAHATGEYSEALRLYREARSLNESAGYRLENAATLRSQAGITLAQGDTAGARDLVDEALALHTELQSPLQILRDHLVLAELAAASGDLDGGRTHISEARALLGRLDARLPRAETAIGEATVLDRAGDATGVLRVLDAASPDLDGIGYGLSWQADVLRARALARLGRLESAAEAGRRAVRTVEMQRRRIGAQRRSSFLTTRLDAYTLLVRLLLDLDRVDEAFEVSDAARGRAFLDHLAAAPAATREAVGMPDLATRAAAVDRIAASIDSVIMGPVEERDSDTLDSLETRLGRALTDSPVTTTGNTLLGANRVSGATIRNALLADEALIEYFVADTGAVAFVVRRDGITTIDLGGHLSLLANQGRIARDLLSEPVHDGVLNDILGRLYDFLVEPVLRSGAVTDSPTWYVVPHGPLAYLPFDALRNSRTGRFLVQDRVIVPLPSAASLPLLRSRSSGPWSPATASVVAPVPDELPGTAAEARTVAAAVARTRTVLGDAATEAEMRVQLGAGWSIVHFTGHGFLHPDNPFRSRLELANGDGSSGDGWLELHEVLALAVDSRLVFLSGCETGAGLAFSSSFSRSDDHATLAQAFLFAGADNVVATLWRIEDEGAARFARRFYEHLKSGSAASAMAMAKRDMLADERFSVPSYWAAYQLSGADAPGRAN